MANTSDLTTPSTQDIQSVEEIPTLEDLNNSDVEKLIPTIVYLLVVCIVGIVGNSLVIHIYRTRYKMSNCKCFILCLSVVDLSTCCIAIPLEVATILDQYSFEYQWLCKMSRCFNTLGTSSSSFILLFIAVDRFRKVCKPFGWQIKTSIAKFLCGLAIFIGFMASWPAIFVYGKQTFDIPEFNLTGTECSNADEMLGTLYPFIYASVFGFMFVTGMLAMSILYCFIGHKVRKHTRKMSKMFGRSMSIPNTSSIIDVCDAKINGEIVPNAWSKYDIANNKNIEIGKKKGFTKKKQESDESWTYKTRHDFELSYTMSQESREKQRSQKRLDNLEDLEDNFNDQRVESNTDSEDSGIKIKDETEEISEHQEDKSKTSNELKYENERPMAVNEKPYADIKKEVSPTSSGEIITKRHYVIRQISSISNQFSNVFSRMTSTTSAHTNSSHGTLKKTQFLKQARARKTAFLMFVITLGFILSFLPHLLLMLVRQIKGDFVDDMSDTNRAVYKFFLRSYFLNSAINPVIYSVCDTRFKSACANIFGRCCRKAE